MKYGRFYAPAAALLVLIAMAVPALAQLPPDTTPPTIQSVTASPDTLWPPNHKMRMVTVSAVVTDDTDLEPSWRITGVAVEDLLRAPASAALGKKGEKPPKPNDFDWSIVSDTEVFLRAERLGKSNGRIYMIIIEARDASGNTSTDTVQVRVPHDKRKTE